MKSGDGLKSSRSIPTAQHISPQLYRANQLRRPPHSKATQSPPVESLQESHQFGHLQQPAVTYIYRLSKRTEPLLPNHQLSRLPIPPTTLSRSSPQPPWSAMSLWRLEQLERLLWVYWQWCHSISFNCGGKLDRDGNMAVRLPACDEITLIVRRMLIFFPLPQQRQANTK